VSNISKKREQPQEPWYHTGGLKRHFYFNVDMNNAQVGTRQSYARLPADTPKAIMLSGKKKEGKERKQFGKYTLAGARNSKPYYHNAEGYHLFFIADRMGMPGGWCIDPYLGYGNFACMWHVDFLFHDYVAPSHHTLCMWLVFEGMATLFFAQNRAKRQPHLWSLTKGTHG
jgi:hypothetical protein